MADDLRELFSWRFGDDKACPRIAEEEVHESARTLLAHRSHRRYLERTVDEDLLQLLLASAFSIPSKSDLQQCSVIVVRDGEKRQALADLIPSMPWIGQAPVFMVFCGDSRRIRRIAELRGKPFANDHLDAFLNAAADAAMHLAAFIAAADGQGLGTCPISVLRNHIEAVTEILELPQWVFPFAGCCLGWPARDGYVSMRLPIELTVHEDRYDDGKLERLIEQYDRDRHQRFAIPPASQRDPESFGEVDLYGWSEDKARQLAKPERADLGAFLRRHGFNLD